MFEGLVEKLIMSYLKDYIENLDKNKLSVGILSGSLTLENILIRAKAINDLKLPFRLVYGCLGKLDIKIPWKSNFSAPTVINIENVQIVLSLIHQDEWEFLEFFSFENKLNALKKFCDNRIAELTEAFVQEEKSAGYLDRLYVKVIDNLHINFINVNLRIEDMTRKPFYSLGLTLENLLVVNTNEKWEENFIDRNKQKDINVFKLLKIQNFGFYLKTNEVYFISNLDKDNKKSLIREEMNKLFPINSQKGKDIEYLINPISLVAKMKQHNANPGLTMEVNANPPKIHISINLENFDVNFYKNQFDTIIVILNHITKYQKFQMFRYESRKFQFFKADPGNKDKKLLWKYAYTCVIKRLRYLQGNSDEFKLSPFILSYYKTKFHEIYSLYLKEPNASLINNENWNIFKKIILVVDLNILYEWAIINIQEYFVLNKKEENKKSKKSFLGGIFGRKKISDEDLLTKDEVEKIQEIIEYAKKEVKNEIISSNKDVKIQLDFHLNEGNFNFSNMKSDNLTLEAFAFKYKNLCFMLKNAESFTEIEAQLSEFHVEMSTRYNRSNVKTIEITIKDDTKIVNIPDYIWKLKLRINSGDEKINSKLELHINNLNMIYHQSFLERVLSFFIVEASVEEDLKNRAWDKWLELKEKTSEKIKLALETKNIVEINIEPRRVIIPLNKYDFKRSKMLVVEIGKVTMFNADSTELYEDQYLLDFGCLSILHWQNIHGNNPYEIVSNLRPKLLMSILSNYFISNEEVTLVHPIFKIALSFESVRINMTESIYYMFHFIIDVMKPTKNQDYWAVVEQSKLEIKKNSKAIGKVHVLNRKKNKYLEYYETYEEAFAVLSGGYIYFYKTVDEDDFYYCYYIKDGVITEKQKIRVSGDKVNIIYHLIVTNKYGTLELEFTSESKFKQWNKSLKERINEMKPLEDNLRITANPSNTNRLNLVTNLAISFGVEINIADVTIFLYDEKTLDELYTLKLSQYNFLLLNRTYDIEIQMSLFSIQVFDELFKNHKHKDSFHELITSVDLYQSHYKLFSVNILLAEPESPKYKNAGIEIDMKIGYLYAIWRPQSLRRLLMFFAHNDVLRNKIKEEVIGVPGLNVNSECVNTNTNINIQPDERPVNCKSTPNVNWIHLVISFQSLSIIWVQPILCHYFIEAKMGLSKLEIAMTQDHFVITGTIGNVKLTDLTNYPYTIKSQDEYLELINTKASTNFHTEILGFKDSSSLSFEYHSYSHFCPLMKNNYTSSAKVYFNSVRLAYIQEHFFRVFNYIFQDFLGSLSAGKEIKEYRNIINKVPVNNNNDEYMNLHVEFNNPQVLIKSRQKFDQGFLADFGNVIITNSYQTVLGKMRNSPQIEKTNSVYHFNLRNLYLVSIKDNFKLIEDTDANIKMFFINLTEEEKLLPNYVIDKSFSINLEIGQIKLNLRQKDFTYLMKCNDLNFMYQDGLDKHYNYSKENDVKSVEIENKTDINEKLNEDELTETDVNTDISCEKSNDNQKDYNYMEVKLNIPIISLRLFDNTTFNSFIELVFIEKSLYFVKKNKGSKEINISIKSSEVYNYISPYEKEIMVSYNTSQALPLHLPDPLKSNITSQFNIKIVLEKDGEKNIITKISDTKITLRLDTLNLLRTFFTQGLPFYEEAEEDLPNQYDFNEDNYPGMRVYLEIKNPLISLLSETMINHEQDIICLSTDLVFLYKKEKVLSARTELQNNYVSMMKDVSSTTHTDSEKISLENSIRDYSKDTFLMSVWLYDICPYVCSLNDALSSSSKVKSSRRKLMNSFNFHYETKTLLQYEHPNNYIQSFKSKIEVKMITMKMSYRDAVLFFKMIEYNYKLMNSEYEKKIHDLTPRNNIKMNKLVKICAEKEMNTQNVQNKSEYTDKIIDKGMGLMSIESDGVQIILIDDHANTYYPFLSVILQELKFTNENMSFTQSSLIFRFLFKVVTYNYFAGIWEPLIEKTSALLEIIDEKSDVDLTFRTINFIIDEYRPKHATNINISDLNITFLYSTLNSWIEKLLKLRANYNEEVKKMIDDKNDPEKLMTITNHTVCNHTGRNLILHRAVISKEKTITFSKLASIAPNESFDIPYLEEDDSSDHNDSDKNFNTDISLNLIRENYICFEFPGIDQSKISHNILRIDNIQSKLHKINYIDLLKKSKHLNLDLKNFEYIISEVRYHEIRKFVYFYSPLVFKNKLNKKIELLIKKKDLNDLIIPLDSKNIAGIPYEYLDGTIQFKYSSGKTFSEQTLSHVISIESFLSVSFTKCELKINNSILNLITNVRENKKKKYITINLCVSYILRNCLPVEIEILVNNDQRYKISKSERIYVENLSFQDNLEMCVKFLNFSTQSPVILFNVKEIEKANKSKIPNPNNNSNTNSNSNTITNTNNNFNSMENLSYSTSFLVYDENSIHLKLFATLIESPDSRILVLYSNGVIINHTLLDLKFYYFINKKLTQEVAGQSILNSNGNNSANVLLISDEKHLKIEVESAQAVSEPCPINAIGLSSNIECKRKDKKIIYELIMETHLSLVAQDLEIYTNIISIHPKFVICNNMDMPILVCLKFKDGSSGTPERFLPLEKKPYDFSGTGSASPVCFRPIENSDNEFTFQSGSKWDWSLPVSLINSGFLTIQISGLNPNTMKMYMNIEKKLVGFTTFVILNKTNYYNCQFVVENYSKNISVKIYQENCEIISEYVDVNSKSLYAWSDYNSAKILCLEFMIGGLNTRPLIKSRENIQKYQIEDDRIYIFTSPDSVNTEKQMVVYPVHQVLKIQKDIYSGFNLKIEILTDGMKKTIKISDYIISNKLNTCNSNSRSITETTVRLINFGLSLISDNRNIKRRSSAYNRYEILYLTLNDIYFFNRVTEKYDGMMEMEMQIKLQSMEIDNQYAYVTQYPILLKTSNATANNLTPKNTTNTNQGANNNAPIEKETPPRPFINFTITSLRNMNNLSEPPKITLLNFLIQSFIFSVDSELLEAILNFVYNVTIELNTSITPILSSKINRTHSDSIKQTAENYYMPDWLKKDVIENQYNKFFIQTMETSPIEMMLSLSTKNQSKVVEKYVTSNPILSSLLSTISNVEKANVCLAGSKMHNLYGSIWDVLYIIVSIYKENILKQVFYLFGAIDLLGNPSNLISNLGHGFNDFLQKPIQGMIKGPREGVKGAYHGSVSLVKHTVDGTFNSASKISGGLSKGLLCLTRDDKYISDLEKKKITERPKNFIEGIGYGITSMAGGVYSGVKDVIVKPVEGVKTNRSFSGFGKGVVKGIGGLFTKPISGVLELVSKTSEGIKNTVTQVDEVGSKSVRKPRTFYGKFKHIKSYNFFHADIIDILKNKINNFKNVEYDFYSADIYKNLKGDTILTVFSTDTMYLVDLNRRELKIALNYKLIDAVLLESEDKLRIVFNQPINNKNSAAIFFSPDGTSAKEICERIKEAIEGNSENYNA